jgi:indolepyruvate ferredoxin oxidoreductase
VSRRELELTPGPNAPGSDALARAVARCYAKVLAYKDEYEVARLYTDGSFQAQLAREFEGDPRLTLHFAPPHLPVVDRFFSRRDPDTGRARKWDLGPWFFPVLRLMARFKFLRGTPLDPFGHAAHRKLERRLIGEYEARVEELLSGLTARNHAVAVEIASLPEHVRGFDLVKEAQLAEAQAREAELLAAFHAG